MLLSEDEIVPKFTILRADTSMITLKWTGNTKFQYDVQIMDLPDRWKSQGPNNGMYFEVHEDNTELLCDIPFVEPGRKYELRLRMTMNQGKSWTTGPSVRLRSAAPIPSLIRDVTVTGITQTSACVVWKYSDIGLLDSFEVQINEIPTLQQTKGMQLELRDLVTNTEYCIRVRGRNVLNVCGPWSEGTLFRTLPTPPTAGRLFVDRVTCTSARLWWPKSVGTDIATCQYQIHCSKNGLQHTVDGTSIVLTDLSPFTPYTYWIIPQNIYGIGSSSETVSFRTNGVTLDQNLDGICSTDDVVLSWGKPKEGANKVVKWKIVLQEMAEKGKRPIHVESELSADVCRYVVHPLPSGQKFEIQLFCYVSSLTEPQFVTSSTITTQTLIPSKPNPPKVVKESKHVVIQLPITSVCSNGCILEAWELKLSTLKQNIQTCVSFANRNEIIVAKKPGFDVIVPDTGVDESWSVSLRLKCEDGTLGMWSDTSTFVY
eukprot:PhF_6_TR8668/c0_g1_i1/m.13558